MLIEEINNFHSERLWDLPMEWLCCQYYIVQHKHPILPTVLLLAEVTSEVWEYHLFPKNWKTKLMKTKSRLNFPKDNPA